MPCPATNPPQALAALPPPQNFVTLEKEHIAEGAYGKVFRGVLLNTKQRVAVKVGLEGEGRE